MISDIQVDIVPQETSTMPPSKDIYTNRKLFEEVLERCRSHVPGWRVLSFENLLEKSRVTPISGGLTNLLHLVELNEEQATAVGSSSFNKCVLRIFGHSEFTNRKAESYTVSVVSRCKLSETVFHEWSEGRISSYIEGSSLLPEQFASTRCSSLVSRRLGQLHSLNMDKLSDYSNIRTTLEYYCRSWAEMALKTDVYKASVKAAKENPEAYSKLQLNTPEDIHTLPDHIKKFILGHLDFKSNPDNSEVEGTVLVEKPRPTKDERLQLTALLNIPRLKDEVDWLINKLDELQLPIDFCHNDCHGYNCMYVFGDNPSKDTCNLIDYEYSGLNYRGFDLANSTIETTIRYVGPYPGFNIDLNRQSIALAPYIRKQDPDAKYTAFEKTFYEGFIEGFNNTIQNNNLPHELTKLQVGTVDSLAREAAWLQLGSSLQWTLWSIPLADYPAIDFGYIEYGLIRFFMYLQWKEKLIQIE